MTAYDLTIAGEYEKAVQAYSQELAQRPDLPTFNSRAAVHLLLGDHNHALADYAVAGYLDQTDITIGDCGHNHVAAVLWLKGAYKEAAALWHCTVKQMIRGRFTHTDLAGGVECGCFLWFAAARLSKMNFAKLRKSCLRRN